MKKIKATIYANIVYFTCVASETIKRVFFDFEDYLFEKKYALDLSGIIETNNLLSDHHDSISHAMAYQAVWIRNLRELFSEAKKTGYKFENFIDIGSGKGKACFYAHKKNIFNHIIGVDFSEPLVEIANINKKKLNSKNISFINADAIQFVLPNQTCLVFMFNPFDSTILEKFISNNINHFNNFNSIIAYANDIHRLSLTRLGFEIIFRNDTRRISLYKLVTSKSTVSHETPYIKKC